MNSRLRTVVAYALATGMLLALLSTNVSAEETAADRYKVPEGDVEALVKFVEGLRSYRPTTTAEILAYRKKIRGAFRTAADRILKLEKDQTSEAYRLAGALDFQLRFDKIVPASEKVQRDFYEELSKYVDAAKTTSRLDVALANTLCELLEKETENVELAEEAYAAFGKRFSTHEDEELANYGQRMVGVSRRLGLPGSEMQVEGKTVAGEEFDWKSYRGKVVLVDYWATWCGPCIAELPNLKENYEKYHDKGFEVVGISLDENRNRLQRFLTEEEIPWACLFDDGNGPNHPMAKYYGITGIPTTILVDRDGKVVKMNVRGGDLGRQLAKIFGPADDSNAGE
jgi:thiol-disulfide isomerase/thioredoxin